jgi:hypothetical protein
MGRLRRNRLMPLDFTATISLRLAIKPREMTVAKSTAKGQHQRSYLGHLQHEKAQHGGGCHPGFLESCPPFR